EGVLNPGEFHLLTHGDLNTPRWLDTFDEVTLLLDRRFVAEVVREDLPEDRIVFVSQRSRSDPTVARYAAAFREERSRRTQRYPVRRHPGNRVHPSLAQPLCGRATDGSSSEGQAELLPVAQRCGTHPRAHRRGPFAGCAGGTGERQPIPLRKAL